MPSPSSPVELVKKAAVEAVEAGKPVHLLFGTVLSKDPLKIQVDQKSIYTEKMLILTRNVTDYDLELEMDYQTGNNEPAPGEDPLPAHFHPCQGRKTFRVCNGLEVGETVLLLRVQRGKKFVVIDRIS